jgi:hypothetical protein
MDTERAPAIALAIIAAGALIKSVWIIAGPESFKKATGWWVNMARHVNTLLGIALVLIAVTLWAVVLLDQSLVNWVVGLIGGACVYAASLYFRREPLDKLSKAFVLDRSPNALRAWGVIGVLISLALGWIAFDGF